MLTSCCLFLQDEKSAESYVVMCAHHLLMDGVSQRIVVQDLASAYLGKALEVPTTSFQEYSHKVAKYLAEGKLPKSFGTTGAQAAGKEGEATYIEASFGNELTRSLFRACGERGGAAVQEVSILFHWAVVRIFKRNAPC